MNALVDKSKFKFLITNLAKGLATLFLIVIGLLLLKNKLADGSFEWATDMHPLIVYFGFLISEVVFGVIPPEFFMVWSIDAGLFDIYAVDILFLSIISYGAGILGYHMGALMSYASWFHRIKNKYFSKVEMQLVRYGGFLIFVGALTPLPYSGICMLVGAYNYPFPNFLFYALSRFVRYGLYSFIIWETLKG